MKLIRLCIALLAMHTTHAASSFEAPIAHEKSDIWSDALWNAIVLDDEEALKAELASVADIDAQPTVKRKTLTKQSQATVGKYCAAFNQKTLLMQAAEEGSIHCLNELLARGASTTRQDHYHDTALMLALSKAHFECAKALIKHAVETEASLNNCNAFGQTALHLAAAYGSEELVAMLIDAGAATAIIDNRGFTPLHKLMSSLDINTVTMRFATRRERTERAIGIMHRLLAAGVPLDAQDNDGWTALHHAAYTSERPDLRVYEALIARGANTSIKTKPGPYSPGEELAAELIEQRRNRTLRIG